MTESISNVACGFAIRRASGLAHPRENVPQCPTMSHPKRCFFEHPIFREPQLQRGHDVRGRTYDIVGIKDGKVGHLPAGTVNLVSRFLLH